jgi:Helix-hairpin-helix motif
VKRSTKAIIGGFCLGTILLYGWRWYYGRRRIRTFHLTNDDLNYSDWSPGELVSEHLIDLNSASAVQMTELGLSAETQDRLIENRPYRTKLELVSRMVLSPEEYAAIRGRVSVAEANEPVKIA